MIESLTDPHSIDLADWDTKHASRLKNRLEMGLSLFNILNGIKKILRLVHRKAVTAIGLATYT